MARTLEVIKNDTKSPVNGDETNQPKPETTETPTAAAEPKAKVKTRDVRLSAWEIAALEAAVALVLKADAAAIAADPEAKPTFDPFFGEVLRRKLEAGDTAWVRMPADHPLAAK